MSVVYGLFHLAAGRHIHEVFLFIEKMKKKSKKGKDDFRRELDS